jgi:outer membrane protein
MNEMKTKFEGDQKALVELQQEIDKKSSAWSKDVQAEKVRELQTKQRELQVKSEDAKLELKQLQDKELEPILKMLQTVVDAYGEKEGYSVILDSKVAVLYASPETDVSDAVKEELDKRLK